MSNKKLVQAELEQIAEENNGFLFPKDVVKFAENKDAALHDQFEWDDTAAGHKYRVWQARKIIKVAVTIIKSPEREIDTFVSLSKDRYHKGGYRLMTDVLTNADLRTQLLKQLRNEISTLQRKYREVKELIPSFEAIDKAISEVIEETATDDIATVLPEMAVAA